MKLKDKGLIISVTVGLVGEKTTPVWKTSDKNSSPAIYFSDSYVRNRDHRRCGLHRGGRDDRI